MRNKHKMPDCLHKHAPTPGMMIVNLCACECGFIAAEGAVVVVRQAQRANFGAAQSAIRVDNEEITFRAARARGWFARAAICTYHLTIGHFI